MTSKLKNRIRAAILPLYSLDDTSGHQSYSIAETHLFLLVCNTSLKYGWRSAAQKTWKHRWRGVARIVFSWNSWTLGFQTFGCHHSMQNFEPDPFLRSRSHETARKRPKIAFFDPFHTKKIRFILNNQNLPKIEIRSEPAWAGLGQN